MPGSSGAHLAHGDFDGTHIYIDPDNGTFTGIIDFGEIRGTDLVYDLGHLLLHDGQAERPAIFPYVLTGFSRVIPQPDDVSDGIRLQALAIATRALAIQLKRPPSTYRNWLQSRIETMIREREETA